MATSNDKTIHNLPAIKNRWRVTMRRVILTKRTLYCAGGGCLVGDSSFRSCLVSSRRQVSSCLVLSGLWRDRRRGCGCGCGCRRPLFYYINLNG